MSIDWITVAAQIVNFLVLVWLLKKFLYRPVLDGIDAREAEISERMGEAGRIRIAAQAKEAEHKAEIAALSATRAEILAKSRREAEAERDALLAETRDRLSKEQAKRDQGRIEEAQRYTAGLHESGAQALLALTRKALKDLADETLERRIVDHAATRLKTMADDLRKAAGDSRDAIALTRDPLPEEAQIRLRKEMDTVLPGFTLRFDVDPALSPGLNLRLGGAQIGWTVDSYLDGLDQVLQESIDRPVRKGLNDAA